ncbi:MAG TPA: hypothetical protein PLV92_25195 [Pirellulaceae bacterium]|nr:hypothetical protein [Pirellulaceae bacterium]
MPPEPVIAAEPHHAPVEAVVAHVETAREPELPRVEEVNYEPDQERRDKFFSRLSRWAKK